MSSSASCALHGNEEDRPSPGGQEWCDLLVRREKKNGTVCYIKTKNVSVELNWKQLVQKITFTFTRSAPSPVYCCLGDGALTDSQQRKERKKMGFFFCCCSWFHWCKERMSKGASWNCVEQAGEIWAETLLCSTLQSKHDLTCPSSARRISSHTLRFGSHTLSLSRHMPPS